ncbi:hypothetical protein DIPPA_08564 [Diplonema papillatum]|nr:hypothetical protein DIPPA_08564 [Diplonema papillatum]
MWRRSFLLRACAVKKTPQETPRLLTTSRENIEGTVVTKELGVVVGNAVLGKNLFSDFLSRMQNLLGGELGLYTHLVEEATAAATRKAMAESEMRACSRKGE